MFLRRNIMTSMTTAQMKAELAKINPPVAPQAEFKEGLVVADVISGTAATVVKLVENAGSDTLSFMDRVKTGYQFQRALDTGKIILPDAAPATPAPRTKRVTKGH
jgi:hypothetical protein